ncbi:hypothetical protein J2T57_001497 [Natronocella acetinitrilica]|uniref:Uncharacterized protein n=1 Tax=Natronocella acetinitrilica TaxID=414046 RepID=A0AAE3G232_9GAMM|nr:hypothetical protein [Natronocella acetinitrilica]
MYEFINDSALSAAEIEAALEAGVPVNLVHDTPELA